MSAPESFRAANHVESERHPCQSVNYIQTQMAGQNHYTIYTVLDGAGQVFRPFPRGAKSGTTRWCRKGPAVLLKMVPPRGAEIGTVSKPNEVNPISKGGPARERWQIQKDIDSVEQQIERAKNDRDSWPDKWGVEHPEAKPRPEAQKRIATLKQRRQELFAELDALT